MIKSTKFMNANTIANEHNDRKDSLKADKNPKFRSLIRSLLDKFNSRKPEKTFADIRYAAQEQERIYNNVMQYINIAQKTHPEKDIILVTVNCCDGRTPKTPQLIKPEYLLNYRPKINTIRKQLENIPNSYGFISFEVKYDSRLNVFLPHYHIIILGTTESDVKNLFYKLYPKKYSFRIDLNNFKITKPGNILIKYMPQELKIIDIKNITSLEKTPCRDNDDIQNIASYICKFKTYQTNFYQQGLKIKVYKNKPYCRPEAHIHNLHLLFMDRLNYAEQFTVFNKKMMTKLITNSKTELVDSALKYADKTQKINKLASKNAEHNTYKKPIKTNKNLLKMFGYDNFKSQTQKDIIDYMRNHKSCLVIQPTSFGKSFCYQAVALQEKGPCIVVEPTKSLMFDQCTSLNKVCKKLAITINSDNSIKHKRYLQKLRKKKYKFLFISPEMLQNTDIQHSLKQLDVSMIVIDEAHCIDFWGGDFRPKYNELQKSIVDYPNAKLMALTATADKITQKRIKEVCNYTDMKIFTGNLDRPNIKYSVIKKEDDGIEQLLNLLVLYINNGKPKEPIIIYCNHRDYVTAIHNALKDQNIDSLMFTGKIKHPKKILNKFMKHNKIVVATNAFGMGIDKPNVRLIIHFEIPQNLEFYYQESGRAGRDGKIAKSVIMYSDDDIRTVEKEFCKTDLQKRKFEKVIKYIKLSSSQRRKWLLKSIK